MSRCAINSGTDWAKSVLSRAAQFPGWFGKHPASVLLDKSISSEAKVLYGILALKTYKTREKSNLADASTRGMAILMGVGASTISRWMKELERSGHIERLSPNKSRGVYRLVSPVFDYRVRVETAANAVADVSSERLTMLRDKRRKCPKCGVQGRVVSTAGVCDDCLADWVRRSATA